jgi:hypothetical protein
MSRITPFSFWLLVSIATCFAPAGCSQRDPVPADTNRPAPLLSAQRLEARDIESLEGELAPRLSRTTRDLKATASPNGGAHFDLTDRFQHATVAIRKADGSLERSCVTTRDELSDVMRRAQEASR